MSSPMLRNARTSRTAALNYFTASFYVPVSPYLVAFTIVLQLVTDIVSSYISIHILYAAKLDVKTAALNYFTAPFYVPVSPYLVAFTIVLQLVTDIMSSPMLRNGRTSRTAALNYFTAPFYVPVSPYLVWPPLISGTFSIRKAIKTVYHCQSSCKPLRGNQSLASLVVLCRRFADGGGKRGACHRQLPISTSKHIKHIHVDEQQTTYTALHSISITVNYRSADLI
ncbi:hypothetical protein J6590_028987 [Homalodisca vitripennis]|nr:hypothetical protein J6590_028987 [Homalodisca vitripennis]